MPRVSCENCFRRADANWTVSRRTTVSLRLVLIERFEKNAMLLRLYRISNWRHRARVPLLPRAIYIFNRLAFAATVPHSATIGRGVVPGYQGLGIVVHKRAVIGDRVIVEPGATIGGGGPDASEYR